jgi:hypothetical protein
MLRGWLCMCVGYARVSTTDQNLDPQCDAFTQADCARILTDTAIGRRMMAGTVKKEDRMSLAMTKPEREAFLADVHVGIISIAEEGRGPLTVPICYACDSGGELRVVTARASRKGRLLARAGRFSLCVQSETPPYQSVSVEGAIISTEPVDLGRDVRPLAHRYLRVVMGDRYIEQTRNAHERA